MIIRNWLKFYDVNASVEARINADEDAVCLLVEDYEQIPNMIKVRLTQEEAEEFAHFLLKIAGELE